MYYLRRDRIRVYPHVWELPFLLLYWLLLLFGWVAAWTVLWGWESLGPSAVRAARTTKSLLGWPR